MEPQLGNSLTTAVFKHIKIIYATGELERSGWLYFPTSGTNFSTLPLMQ